MSKHTPEPWESNVSHKVIDLNCLDESVPVEQYYELSVEDYNRAAKCVNACATIGDEDLAVMSEYFGKQGRTYYTLVQDMRQAQAERDQLKAERDELLDALEKAQKHMQKSGINYDNADVWNAITKAINNTKGGSHESSI